MWSKGDDALTDETLPSADPAAVMLAGADIAFPSAVAKVSDTLASAERTTGLEVTAYTSSLKIYQTDLETACLFLLPTSELLVSFKTSFARLDRCTGRAYARLHERQSLILTPRSRFNRLQRIHTSDGDMAQNLAERVLAVRMRHTEKQMVVTTFRSQCQVHRVFHVLGMGMKLVAEYITGQIRMALSLRGPGHFGKFKKFFWSWLVSKHQFIFEEVPLGAGIAAEDHHKSVWDTFFPKDGGKSMRSNRVKYWALLKIPNGDIRISGVSQHYCKKGCCRGRRDFLRKLKWAVAILSGRLCIVINRGRWTKTEEGVDWVGFFESIHSLLSTIYPLWYTHMPMASQRGHVHL